MVTPQNHFLGGQHRTRKEPVGGLVDFEFTLILISTQVGKEAIISHLLIIRPRGHPLIRILHSLSNDISPC